jgi:hypothetical protein
MSEKEGGKPLLSTAGQRAAEQRRERLAAALRENLRKRKAQERARSDTPPLGPNDRGNGRDTD